MRQLGIAASTVLVLAGLAGKASAVIITRGDGRMTKPAPAALGGSSLAALEGEWNSLTGTPIGSHYFITTAKAGGDAGGTFTLGGSAFTTNAYYDDPNSDLRIYRTDQAFSNYAPLYTKADEKGKAFVVFGRGAARGSALLGAQKKLKGWAVKPSSDGALSWGTNRVWTVAKTGVPLGDLLVFAMNPGNTKFEAALTEGDVGGGLFIRDGKGGWKLAGVNYGGDLQYWDSGKSEKYDAVLLDKGGMIAADGTPIKDLKNKVPGTYESTRISSNTSWIEDVMAGKVSPTGLPPSLGPTGPVPEPASVGLVMGAAAVLGMRRRRAK